MYYSISYIFSYHIIAYYIILHYLSLICSSQLVWNRGISSPSSLSSSSPPCGEFGGKGISDTSTVKISRFGFSHIICSWFPPTIWYRSLLCAEFSVPPANGIAGNVQNYNGSFTVIQNFFFSPNFVFTATGLVCLQVLLCLLCSIWLPAFVKVLVSSTPTTPRPYLCLWLCICILIHSHICLSVVQGACQAWRC